MPIIVEQYPFYAPMIFALYTLGLRYCHVAAMRCSKLSSDGVIAIDETYDVSANVFSPVEHRKKAPPVMALESRTLELVRRHRRYLMHRNHPGQPGCDGGGDAPGVDGLMQLVPTEPVVTPKGRDLGRDGRGRDRDSDEEHLQPPELGRRAA